MTDEEIVEKIWGKEVGLFREIVERYEIPAAYAAGLL